MGFVLESTFLEVTCSGILLFWILYSYVTQNYSYWKDRGVPSTKPSFPFGSSKDLFLGTKHIGLMYDDYCKDFKNVPYFGIYEGRRPTLIIQDPEILKHILTKDFSHFVDRFVIPINLKTDYLANHLFNMSGKEWKNMRLKLAPTFTSGKMKAMFFLMKKCKEQLEEHLVKATENVPVVDIKDVLARFTMDIIASCAFGLEINSLTEKNCEFYNIGIKIFKPSTLISLIRRLVFVAVPILSKIYMPRFIPQDVTSFLTNIVRDTVKYRKENNIFRNDFLDLLIKIRESKSVTEESQKSGFAHPEHDGAIEEAGLSIEEMAGQAFVFFVAGFETASSTMTFCLYELAQHLEVQDRLYREIKQVLDKYEGELTYQALQEMTYMDQVINETLRRYGSLAILNRTCTEPYKMPNSDLVLEKGQRIVIPTYSIHHNENYYPEPYKFDPERFSSEKSKGRHPYVHLPFGEGPRMCIGMRFGLLQTKTGLTALLSNFEVKMSPETQVPVTLHKTSFVTMPEKPILLRLTKRQEESV